jgi:adenylate cyclase
MEPSAHELQHEEAWRKILTGDLGALGPMRRVLGKIPAEPRCKLCAAPFGNPGKMALRVFGFGPSRLNRRLCRMLPLGREARWRGDRALVPLRGRAGIDRSRRAHAGAGVLSSSPASAGHCAGRRQVERPRGQVRRGRGCRALACRASRAMTASQAVGAARDLLRETGNDADEPWVPVGAGVHTGVAYVGRVGEGDACDFTAVGDAVNTTSRLASSAGAGDPRSARCARPVSISTGSSAHPRCPGATRRWATLIAACSPPVLRARRRPRAVERVLPWTIVATLPVSGYRDVGSREPRRWDSSDRSAAVADLMPPSGRGQQEDVALGELTVHPASNRRCPAKHDEGSSSGHGGIGRRTETRRAGAHTEAPSAFDSGEQAAAARRRPNRGPRPRRWSRRHSRP